MGDFNNYTAEAIALPEFHQNRFSLDESHSAIAGDDSHSESFCINLGPKFRAILTKERGNSSKPDNPAAPLNNSVPSTLSDYVYILCLKKRYGHAKHYIGMVRSQSVRKLGIEGAIRRRQSQHRKGYGAAFLAAVAEVKIPVRIGGWWEGGHELEKKMKRQDRNAFCKFCRKKYLRDRAREYRARKAGAKHTRQRKSLASFPLPPNRKPTPHRLSKLTGLPRSTVKLYQGYGLLASDQALAKAAGNGRLEEKRLFHPCETCVNDVHRVCESAKWPSRVCNGCHSRLELVRQYDAEDPYRGPDLLEMFIRNQFTCPLELVLDLLGKETRDENRTSV